MPEYQLRQAPDGMYMNVPIYSEEELEEMRAAAELKERRVVQQRKPKKPIEPKFD